MKLTYAMLAFLVWACAVLAPQALAETVFLEAETMQLPVAGWRVSRSAQARRASRAAVLNGAKDDVEATAWVKSAVGTSGRWRIWVRYMQHSRWRGPFKLTVSSPGRDDVGAKVLDLEVDEATPDWEYRWDAFEADLDAGPVTLRLSKHEQRNCSGYVRNVDCFLLTDDLELVPDHIPFGPQTYVRVTLGKGYERPVQIHVFADHYRSPWYGHYHLSKGGVSKGLAPPPGQLLRDGEQTPWCNITRMLYQDSGAILNLSPRYTYREHAPRLQAAFEFATAPDAASVVRTVEVDREPSGLVIVMPPDLATPENAARLKVDRDVAAETGRLADAFDWPQIGRFPTAFPFFAAVRVGGYGHTVSAAVSAREWRTLDYFGFSNRSKPFIHGGIWHCRDGSYCAPDLDRMRAGAAAQADTFRASGRSPAEIAFCMLMDEPQGQPSSFLASDPACIEGFRAWLKALRLEPADLLVENWGDVRPVVQSDRAAFPGLHYYTQRFRTRALGDFLAAQRAVLEEAYGAAFPTLVNFSDGAVYQANMYAMGVDYFELLDCDRQNAIWGEDWANLASTYQCASYNIELMRAAARDRGQMIGHYLIAYAGRTPWDVKLKGVSAVARGVKVLKNFFYGPSWGSHEGGPFWQSSAWYSRPETWRANAELVREIGAVEDMLVPAKPIPADVALLYSSSTDIWTLRGNGAYGFDRMHTWLALAHAQVPVDIVSERQASAGQLHGYRVCYLSGPNLTRRSAAALRDWVRAGGTLWLTAGAGERDEYNRPLELLSDILPARRLELTEFQSHKSAGKFLHTLVGRDTVSAGPVTVEVLSVREVLEPRAGATVSGRYADGRAAMVRGAYGSGSITCVGFLPALAYIKAAECARNALAEPAAADAVPPVPDAVSELLQRSYNPWEFPGAVRELILRPVRQAGVVAPVTCDVPLIDAVAMDCNLGVLLPLANYTLRPLDSVGFSLAAPRRTLRVESVHRGEIPFSTEPDGRIRFELPLAATDFVKVYLAAP